MERVAPDGRFWRLDGDLMPAPVHQPTFTPYTLPPVLQGQPTGVFRYVNGMFFPLPSVRWTEITYRKGPYPPRATFRYAYGEPAGFAGAPFETVLPVVKSYTTFDTVYLDDRLVVATIDMDGNLAFLFDGFVQIPEASISGQNYTQSFQAQGVAIRCWDIPIMGSFRRDMNSLTDPMRTIYTDIPARVNPDGKPNRTAYSDTSAFDYDYILDGFQFPVFTDDLMSVNSDSKIVSLSNKKIQKWDLAGVVRYLLAVGNSKELFVKNPDFGTIERSFWNTNTDGTTSYIYCRDMVISGKPWPEALHQAIHNHGFSFTFRLGTKSGRPYNYITFERERDGQGAPLKSLYLQQSGTTVDPALSNVKGLNLSVDASQVVNAYVVDHKVDEYEIGVILAPGFDIDRVNDPLNTQKFLSTNVDPAANRDKYRLFVADECGEGHYILPRQSFSSGYPFRQFEQLWGLNYVVRRRPGYGPCFSYDKNGQRYNPQLFVVTNWGSIVGQGDPPMLFDKTKVDNNRTPYIIPIKGSWAMLHDRLGVRLTCLNPQQWNIGEIHPSNPAYGKVSSTIDMINNLISYDTAHPENHFFLLLTCVISSDRKATQAIAPKRSTSPTQFAVARSIDAHDRYKRWAVHKSSAYQQDNAVLTGSNLDDTRARFYARDDSAAAQTYAESLRASTETPSMGGSVTIGRLTNNYFVGDRISSIYPRMSMQTNIPTQQYPNRYPMVVQLTWRNEPEQSTTLQLDDRRSESDPVEL
ncbi:hypothetical protein UFOVP124_53 [uncultured Caudovirales phage]|uniref:Uncharacterized protein n=1 Tax=uncultured Caudovirales phage TaxID=2100421 RepID=A0A6J5L984_9CAUD|nr:hypothetical protein UFOVP124_53 [uncultured Caudovirales phage]